MTVPPLFLLFCCCFVVVSIIIIIIIVTVIIVINIIIVFIIIIIVIFMTRRFYKCAGFTWSSCVVQLLLETCAEIPTILSTSSKHVSVGMTFLGLGIGVMSHQSCKSLRIWTNNIVGGSIMALATIVCLSWKSLSHHFIPYRTHQGLVLFNTVKWL